MGSKQLVEHAVFIGGVAAICMASWIAARVEPSPTTRVRAGVMSLRDAPVAS